MELYTDILKRIVIKDNNIIEIAYHDNSFINCEAVKLIFIEFDRLTEGRKIKKLILIGKSTNISEEARQLIITENHIRKSQIIAEAIVVNSFFQKLSANFYILYLKKMYPTHFFTSKDLAIEWLISK
ncbi:MAG: hypothetical protein PSX81_02215 [bacterium]|nr:hypothetical protein [bacterium]